MGEDENIFLFRYVPPGEAVDMADSLIVAVGNEEAKIPVKVIVTGGPAAVVMLPLPGSDISMRGVTSPKSPC